MTKSEKAKYLEYAAGFFCLIFFVVIFIRLTQNDYWYALSGLISFILFMVLFGKYQKAWFESLHEFRPQFNSEPKLSATELRKAQKVRENNSAKVKEFRALLKEIMARKNVELIFRHSEGVGHADYPALWLMSKPLPLAPEELYELYFFDRCVSMRIEPIDGVLCAVGFYFEDDMRIEYSVAPEIKDS